MPIETAKNATSILLSAVFNEEGVSYIYVKKSVGWERREVSVGINNLQHVEIRSGLEEGEVVALPSPDFQDRMVKSEKIFELSSLFRSYRVGDELVNARRCGLNNKRSSLLLW